MMMAILEKFNFQNINPLSVERFHLQAEATKIAYEQREMNIGDPTFNNFDYNKIISLSNESRQKLIQVKPETVAQASRIDGVRASDISLLCIKIKQYNVPRETFLRFEDREELYRSICTMRMDISEGSTPGIREA